MLKNHNLPRFMVIHRVAAMTYCLLHELRELRGTPGYTGAWHDSRIEITEAAIKELGYPPDVRFGSADLLEGYMDEPVTARNEWVFDIPGKFSQWIGDPEDYYRNIHPNVRAFIDEFLASTSIGPVSTIKLALNHIIIQN